jgi:hypothetical protein
MRKINWKLIGTKEQQHAGGDRIGVKNLTKN